MQPSSSGTPDVLGELCRVAEDVFRALGSVVPADLLSRVNIDRADVLTAEIDLEIPHLALHSVLCTQRLRLLGATRATYDEDEVFAQLALLSILLQHILDSSSDDTASMRRLHDVRNRLQDFAMALEDKLVLGNTES